jgi:hypothetical protein
MIILSFYLASVSRLKCGRRGPGLGLGLRLARLLRIPQGRVDVGGERGRVECTGLRSARVPNAANSLKKGSYNASDWIAYGTPRSSREQKAVS